MPNWHKIVYDIFDCIEVMPTRHRRQLWAMLRRAYSDALDDTDPAPLEVWDDPRAGFGPMGAKLLGILRDNGETKEVTILKNLWPDLWTGKVSDETYLRQRLRKLEQRVRNKLYVNRSGWTLYRPRSRHLELIRSSDLDPEEYL